MIQIIGVMIGFYIFTKMLQIGGLKETSISTKIFAGITAIVVIICLVLLFTTGSPTVPQTPYNPY